MTLANELQGASGLDRPLAVDIRNVTKRFGPADADGSVLAIDDVSLQIKRGEFVCLLGPSGCGKSTLLNIVGGLLKQSDGQIEILGNEVKAPLPKDVAFVFQESTLFPWYTIAKNFDVALKFQGVPRSQRVDRTMQALEAVGMEAFARHFPTQLSVGMRQRVNLARSIAMGTDIVLMDEPFAALDEQTRMVLGEDLSSLLAKTGKTIVFVTHSLAEAVYLSDRIVVMTSRPAKVKTIVRVDEPHPRSPEFMRTPRFSEIRNQLYELLHDEIRRTLAASLAAARPTIDG